MRGGPRELQNDLERTNLGGNLTLDRGSLEGRRIGNGRGENSE